MPPRASTSSSADQQPNPNNDDSIVSSTHGTQAEGQEQANAAAAASSSSAVEGGGVSVEDYLLPRTLTQRLAKGVLPPNTQIQRDAALAIAKAATVFVSYISTHANDATVKRTVAPQDVLSAIKELEFDDFLPRLERELAVHAEAAAGKRKGYRQKVKARESGAGTGGEGDGADKNNEEGDGDERGAKRVKREEDNAAVSDGGSGSAGKEVQEKGSKTGSSRATPVVVPNGQAEPEGGEDDAEDEEGEGTEEHEEEGDDEEEEDEDEGNSEEEEEGREGNGTDPDERVSRPNIEMDSDLGSASDGYDDPDDLGAQLL